MGTSDGRGRSRPWRLLRGAVVLVLVLGLVFFVGGGWFYSGEIRDGALASVAPGAPELQSRVLAVGDAAITLARDPGSPEALTMPGTWGLIWAGGGYGRLGAIRSQRPDRVERAFRRLRGPDPRPGELTAVDGYAWPADPSLAAGRPAREVTYPSPLGPVPAWRVDGRRDTWVILVHGYNAGRTETLRTLAAVAAQGFPALAVGYRNDPGAPRSPDGLRHWGATEWRDLEAATRYALDQGARGVVLAGYSMGGAVVASFLLSSPLAARVRGVVLDAPALDLGAVIDHGAEDRTLPVLGTSVPPALTEVAKGIAGVRYDLDWGDLDYVDRAGGLRSPILLFHQGGDPTVPVAISERLARARPDLVSFERFGGDGHVQSWNVDRPRYERALRAFLDRVAPARAAA
ncbi:MAG TPA: alpha/beta hydrolase [Actinomycetes bacterium]|nr:alpha/beta hydrolase [Actinomycetes bacterium]